jgi:hypothetical protein
VVFGGMNNVPPNQMLNALCKKTLITTARWKSYQQKQLMVFMFHIVMVGCPYLKVVLMSITNCCDDLNHCVGGSQKKYVVDRHLCLHYGLFKKKVKFSFKMR